MSRPMLLCAAVLVASMALNAVLILRVRDGPAEGAGPLAGEASETPRGAAADPSCRAQLSKCRQEGMEQVVGLFRHGPSQPRVAPGRETLSSNPGTATPPPVVDLELQQSVLCDLAKRKARERWRGTRQKIAASLLKELGAARSRAGTPKRRWRSLPASSA